MSQSINIILIHGADISENVSLPIAMILEEALEARSRGDLMHTLL